MAALETLPAVTIVANLVSTMAAELLIFAFAIFWIVLFAAEMVLFVKISLWFKVAIVPVLGNVISVVAVDLNVVV